MPDRELYQVIASELSSKNIDGALWTQALAIAEGNPDKTQAAYIRLRLSDLKKSAPSEARYQHGIEPQHLNNGLSLIRSELAKKLLAEKRPNLYATLGLQPSASDSDVTSAIAGFETRALTDPAVSTAEIKYAKETLSDPILREQYDRQLLTSWSPQTRFKEYQSVDTQYSWWESRKTSVIIGVLSTVLLGYLGLGFFNARGGHELQKEIIGVQRDAVHAVTGTEQFKTQAEINLKQQSLEASQEMQRRDLEYRERTAWQAQDLQRQEQERRYAMEQERIKLQQQQIENQRQQTENAKTQREKQYWACINSQITPSHPSPSDAYARCAMYR